MEAHIWRRRQVQGFSDVTDPTFRPGNLSGAKKSLYEKKQEYAWSARFRFIIEPIQTTRNGTDGLTQHSQIVFISRRWELISCNTINVRERRFSRHGVRWSSIIWSWTGIVHFWIRWLVPVLARYGGRRCFRRRQLGHFLSNRLDELPFRILICENSGLTFVLDEIEDVIWPIETRDENLLGVAFVE